MVKNKGTQFFNGEFENEKKKDKIFLDLPQQRFEPESFNNVCALDLNFSTIVEGSESKSVTKTDRTLSNCAF